MDEKRFAATMEHIVAALQERGYDPYSQLLGYVKIKEPTYITSHKNARELIQTLDFDAVERYVDNMKK